ncbi:hypothetical protein QYM46_12920 [Brevibacterium sp. K11IcPPYGO002]|uniref:phage baseplate protein n=1 Tax=Brevibacterium sp. K11IcPPYGO002 TaxID=3058837 RepID=UPI003D815146
MALNHFGGGPSDIVTDAEGNVVGGVQLRVYTAQDGGSRVTELYDFDGTPLSGVVVSDSSPGNIGRWSFQASDNYDQLFMDDGVSDRWVVPARETYTATRQALGLAGEAKTVAEAAKDTAEHALDEVNERLDTYGDLDIFSVAPQFATQLRIPSDLVLQSFDRDSRTGDYYVAQPRVITGSSTESTIIYRCSPAGAVMETMTFIGGGHGSAIAVERDGNDVYIWTWWVKNEGGGPTEGLCRVRWSAGQSIHMSDPLVQAMTRLDGENQTFAAIDEEADRIAIRSSAAGMEHYYLRRLSQFKLGYGEVLASLPGMSIGEYGPYQGHTSLDDYLYVARGGTGGFPPVIFRYEWATGAVDALDVSSAAVGFSGAAPGNYAELESMSVWRSGNGRPSLYFGLATGSYTFRQSMAFVFRTPDTDTPVTPALRSLNSSIQSGSVGIPGGNGTVTTKHVTFKWEFDGTPIVVLTPISSNPDIVESVTVANVTAQGFDAYMFRTSSAATPVSWFAYYGPGMNEHTPA